jgi:hypothetical protein
VHATRYYRTRRSRRTLIHRGENCSNSLAPSVGTINSFLIKKKKFHHGVSTHLSNTNRKNSPICFIHSRSEQIHISDLPPKLNMRSTRTSRRPSDQPSSHCRTCRSAPPPLPETQECNASSNPLLPDTRCTANVAGSINTSEEQRPRVELICEEKKNKK